ncbi:MAG: hypothetical protein ACP5G1_03655 [Nanopusillaceae archaeon]
MLIHLLYSKNIEDFSIPDYVNVNDFIYSFYTNVWLKRLYNSALSKHLDDISYILEGSIR